MGLFSWLRKRKEAAPYIDEPPYLFSPRGNALVPIFSPRDFSVNRTLPGSGGRSAPVKRLLQNNTIAEGGTAHRGIFQESPWDFDIVYAALTTESLLRRAVDKYVELILKEGFKFVGGDPGSLATQYVIKRLQQMEEVTNISLSQLMETIVRQLVMYSNVFIAKARNLKSSGGRIRQTITGKTLMPVAGYFVQDARFIGMDIKLSGQPAAFQAKGFHADGANKVVTWSPQNMIHGYMGRASGAWGIPMVEPVLNDIRALRELEEHIIVLVQRYAIPIIQYSVGTENSPATPEELDEVEKLIRNLPASGAIVTPERHKLTALGLERSAMNAMPYLKHFLERILAGLGMSTVGMGAADTSNKSTALVVSAETRQTAEFMQDVLKQLWDQKIIKELLAEGGFDPFNSRHFVEIRFPNINKEERRAHENHVSQLWQQNLLTETESRSELGRQAVSKKQRKELHNNLYPNIHTNTGAAALAKSKGQPTNQHGTLPAKPAIPKRDEELMSRLLKLKEQPSPEKLLADLQNLITDKGIAEYLVKRARAILADKHYTPVERNHHLCALSNVVASRQLTLEKL